MFDLFKFLRQRRYGSYTKSSRAEKYKEIAALHHTTPQHVYELAHGCEPENTDDDRIVQTLKQEGIVVRF